ncbi:hypothetical protein ACFWN5_37755 [Streptomyces sp. NPDC058430]|uniref:hypothetical protein n=1 Tax=Streptomyces sp. NPDC058430 TaxID=3346495 RepID=UPI00364D2179
MDRPGAKTRFQSNRADLLRSQTDVLPAGDFLETVTLSGARLHEFAVIEHATPAAPGPWRHRTTERLRATQTAKNLAMDLESADCRQRFLIRDATATPAQTKHPCRHDRSRQP